MCHCLLPSRPDMRDEPSRCPGQYVDEALEWMWQCFPPQVDPTAEMDVALIGGATCHDSRIGPSNVEAARAWIFDKRLRTCRVDVGGHIVRRLSFSLGDGTLTITPGYALRT